MLLPVYKIPVRAMQLKWLGNDCNLALLVDRYYVCISWMACLLQEILVAAEFAI